MFVYFPQTPFTFHHCQTSVFLCSINLLAYIPYCVYEVLFSLVKTITIIIIFPIIEEEEERTWWVRRKRKGKTVVGSNIKKKGKKLILKRRTIIPCVTWVLRSSIRLVVSSVLT